MKDRDKPSKSPWFKYFTVASEKCDDLELSQQSAKLARVKILRTRSSVNKVRVKD